jgi:hypothetical protein
MSQLIVIGYPVLRLPRELATNCFRCLERYPSMPIQYRIQYHAQDSHIMRSVRRV